jgi:hypothetical protein
MKFIVGSSGVILQRPFTWEPWNQSRTRDLEQEIAPNQLWQSDASAIKAVITDKGKYLTIYAKDSQ